VTLAELFEDLLSLSASLRPAYPLSLGVSPGDSADRLSQFWPSPVPELAAAIYSRVEGTRYAIADQKLMDLVPGFLLIHIDELPRAYAKVSRIHGRTDLFPLLENYSSDFICIRGPQIYSLLHDDIDLVPMHETQEAFLLTLCELYREQVYFLDDDGYLDYDADREAAIGAHLNPGVPYWVSE
jgi:hypothetical protein